MKKSIFLLLPIYAVAIAFFFLLNSPIMAAPDNVNTFYKALLDGDEGQVKALIARNPGLINARFAGQSPLHIAAEKGTKKMIKYLIAGGADVKARDYNGLTPLHCAAIGGKTDCAEILIMKGADINALDTINKSPLNYAMEHGNKDTENLLRKYRPRE
jgi:ankyrin repeat protein